MLGHLIALLHIIDLRVYAHIATAHKQPRVHVRILGEQLLHHRDDRVRAVLHAEEDLELRVVELEVGGQVGRQVVVHVHEGLEYGDARQLAVTRLRDV